MQPCFFSRGHARLADLRSRDATRRDASAAERNCGLRDHRRAAPDHVGHRDPLEGHAAHRAPMVGGMISATILTLIVIPAI